MAAAIAVGAFLLLAGCSTPAEDPQPPSTDVIGEPTSPETEVTEELRILPAGGEYFFQTADGAVGKFTFPGDPYPPVEEMRALVGAAPITYVTVVVDNRNGSVPVNMYELAAFDADGRKYTFQTVDQTLDQWMAGIGTSDEEISLYNQFVDAVNANMIYADIGQVAEFVMASEDTDLPAEFTRIAIQASGMGNEVEAVPVSDAAADVDLTFEAPE